MIVHVCSCSFLSVHVHEWYHLQSSFIVHPIYNEIERLPLIPHLHHMDQSRLTLLGCVLNMWPYTRKRVLMHKCLHHALERASAFLPAAAAVAAQPHTKVMHIDTHYSHTFYTHSSHISHTPE